MKLTKLTLLAVTASVTIAVQAEDPKPAPGYLSKTKDAPPKLRFASPAKPKPEKLPPLPVTADPQPTHPPEFFMEAAGVTTPRPPVVITTQAPVIAAPIPQIVPVAVPQASGASPEQAQKSATQATVEGGPLTPQMMLKFFPNGRPAGFEMLVDPNLLHMPFQVPLRSSSATYILD